MSRTVRIRDAAGSLVLDLSSAGYELDFDGVNVGGRLWERITASSQFIDGDGLARKRLLAATAEIRLRVTGSTRAEMQSRYQALLDAVEADLWQLEIHVDGVSETYRAQPADSAAGYPTVEVMNVYRTVSLTVPVQPSPVVTGA